MVEGHLHSVARDPEAMMLAGDHQLRGQIKGHRRSPGGSSEFNLKDSKLQEAAVRTLTGRRKSPSYYRERLRPVEGHPPATFLRAPPIPLPVVSDHRVLVKPRIVMQSDSRGMAQIHVKPEELDRSKVSLQATGTSRIDAGSPEGPLDVPGT